MCNYKEKYLMYCEGLCLKASTNIEVQRHNKAMKNLGNLFNELKSDENINKEFLKELLQEGDERTKGLVAAHCLGLECYIAEAKKVLKEQAKNKINKELAFDAEMTLKIWKKEGKLDF